MMMYVPRSMPSKVLASSLLVIIAFMTTVEMTQAKRGCASFGHSCFGGHGKRAVPLANTGGDPEEIPVVGVQHGSDGFVAQESGPLPPQLEVFSRDEGQLDANGLNNLLLKQQRYREPDDLPQLIFFLRKWLNSVNRRQEMPLDK